MADKLKNNDEFIVYLSLVRKELEKYPEQRFGQVLFNVLYYIKPDLADEIRGNPYIDPFYKNGNIPKFFDYIVE